MIVQKNHAIFIPLLIALCIGGCSDPSPQSSSSGTSNGSSSGHASSSSGSGGSSSSSSSSSSSGSGGPSGPWIAWPMPNSPNTGLPNPANYAVDDLNGLVTDKVTGLIWQRTLDPGKYTWDDALAYCDALAYGGHEDWRLPTRIELVSIVDYSQSAPAIDIVAFPGTQGTFFWTSTPLTASAAHAWSINFGDGLTNGEAEQKTFPYRVRCVRG